MKHFPNGRLCSHCLPACRSHARPELQCRTFLPLSLITCNPRLLELYSIEHSRSVQRPQLFQRPTSRGKHPVAFTLHGANKPNHDGKPHLMPACFRAQICRHFLMLAERVSLPSIEHSSRLPTPIHILYFPVLACEIQRTLFQFDIKGKFYASSILMYLYIYCF